MPWGDDLQEEILREFSLYSYVRLRIEDMDQDYSHIVVGYGIPTSRGSHVQRQIETANREFQFVSTTKCEVCGDRLKVKQRRATPTSGPTKKKYCGNSCRFKAYRRRKKENEQEQEEGNRDRPQQGAG